MGRYVEENGAWFPPRSISRAKTGPWCGRHAEVVELINRAATSANGDPNAVGGGITIVQPGSTSQQFSVSYVACDLGPPAAVQAGAAWRIEGDAGYLGSGAQRLRPSARGAFRIEFLKIPGFDLPAPRTVELSDQPVFRVTALYTPAQTPPEIGGVLSTAVRRELSATQASQREQRRDGILRERRSARPGF